MSANELLDELLRKPADLQIVDSSVEFGVW